MMALFALSIIAPCGKTHQPRCPGTQGRGWRPIPTSGRAPIRGKYGLSPPGPRSFQVRLEAEDAHLGAKLPLDCPEITLRIRDR